MEVCALRRFYFSFPVPRLLPRPLLSSLLPKEYGFPTLRRLLWKEYYAHKSSHHSHKTYIDLSTPRQTSTPLEGERVTSVPPSEGEKFPAFYAHLPKVRKGHTAPRAYCSHVFRHITPIPPSEGEKFPAFYAHLPKVTLHCFPVLLKHYPETPRKYSLSDTILSLDAICYSNLF